MIYYVTKIVEIKYKLSFGNIAIEKGSGEHARFAE